MAEFGDAFFLGDWVDVVVLRTADGHTTTVSGNILVDLCDEGPPGPDLLSELMDSTVRLTAGEGCSLFVRDSLRAIPVPALFAASPWLAASRPVIVRDGSGLVGGLLVRYSDATGLRIADPEADRDVNQDQDG
ncbi:hypothetical protein [Micromonospora chokoriensis]